MSKEELLKALTKDQSKSRNLPKVGLMAPGSIAQSHPAGPLLQQFAELGCTVDISEEWSLEALDKAVAYGAHPSARTPEAAKACRDEALEKVAQGFVTLIPWSKLRELIKQRKHTNTKISPIAAIPHKSRLYRMILDLSRKGQGRPGQAPVTAVNDLTNEEAAPLHAMSQLGKVLPRIIFNVAIANEEDGPLLFCKIDIKDGFWRMCVAGEDEHQFCYVLPPTEEDTEPMIVVPSALQMGWISSPPDFCAATETARDVAESLRETGAPDLPPHPMEADMVDAMQPGLCTALPDLDELDDEALREHLLQFQHLFEVYVDDFIGLIQSTDEAVLRHHSRALLHAIHQLFPRPEQTGHTGEDPISQKKLKVEGEGIWDTRKEILGWIFDGLERTMEPPPQKIQKIRKAITTILRRGWCDTTEFRSILGKLQHASMGIPAGASLLAPLYNALRSAQRNQQQSVQIHANSAQSQALVDFRALFTIMSSRPTHCKELIPGLPAFIGNVDACKWGVGGTWIAGNSLLAPIVWRLKWPPKAAGNQPSATPPQP